MLQALHGHTLPVSFAIDQSHSPPHSGSPLPSSVFPVLLLFLSSIFPLLLSSCCLRNSISCFLHSLCHSSSCLRSSSSASLILPTAPPSAFSGDSGVGVELYYYYYEIISYYYYEIFSVCLHQISMSSLALPHFPIDFNCHPDNTLALLCKFVILQQANPGSSRNWT